MLSDPDGTERSGQTASAAAKALAHVQEQIDTQIKSFKDSRRFYRRGSLIQTVSSATLAATTTILIGLDQIYKQAWLAALSLVAAGLTTILAAWGAWFGFRKLWVSNQRTLNNLYELRARIEYEVVKANGVLDQEVVDNFYERYQEILSSANATWAEARESRE
jgi:hypothetical protein